MSCLVAALCLLLLDSCVSWCMGEETGYLLDFGTTESEGGVLFNAEALSEVREESGITYRALQPGKRLVVKFPAFNHNEQGFPQTPMLLEVKFKDCTPAVPVYSRIDYIKPDPAVGANKICPLGIKKDATWCIQQYPFFITPLVSLRAIEGSYTFAIGPAAAELPIDAFSLRAVTLEECRSAMRKFILSRKKSIYEYPPEESVSALVPDDLEVQVFARDIMHPIYLITKPQPEEEASLLQASTALGETEPLSFAIYSEQGVEGINFKFSELYNHATETVIPQANISLFQVVYDYRHQKRSGGNLIPDRLEECVEVAIPAQCSQRFWIKVRVPEDIPGGDYEGTLEVRKKDLLKKTLRLKLQVVPIKLDSPRHLNPVYHDPYLKVYSSDRNEVFKLLREIQFDPFYYLVKSTEKRPTVELIRDSLTGEVIDFDTTGFKNELNEMQAKGFLKDKLIVEPYAVWREFIGSYKDAELYARLSTTAFKAIYGKFIQRIIEAAKDFHAEVIFSIVDEPDLFDTDGFKRLITDRLATAIKEAGGMTTATYTYGCELSRTVDPKYNLSFSLPPLTDLIDYKVWLISDGSDFMRGYNKMLEERRIIGDTAEGKYTRFGYYTTFFSFYRNLLYNRLAHGYFAFATDARVVSAYALGDYNCDQFNDFDGDYYGMRWPDFLFAYRSFDAKMIYAMNSEGIREGIKDARYLATLRRLIVERPGRPEGREATEYLNSLKEKIAKDFWLNYVQYNYDFTKPDWYYAYYNPIFRHLSEDGKITDFAAFTRVRQKLIGYIQRLLVALYGDVSGNGTISAYDAALALAGSSKAEAEVSGVTPVTAYDAALIAQRAVGLISRFPVEG